MTDGKIANQYKEFTLKGKTHYFEGQVDEEGNPFGCVRTM